MKDLKEFDISFSGLKEGMHQFEYRIEKEFFDLFNFDEFYKSEVTVSLSFLKKATMFELNFDFDGWVEVACDVTNEHYEHPVKTDLELIVKFGDEYNNENEELLIIPFGDYKCNIAQYIYEAIVLAMPLKKRHPGIDDGSLKSEVLEKLKDFEPKDIEENNTKDTDPRWDKLKEILIDKNTDNGTS